MFQFPLQKRLVQKKSYDLVFKEGNKIVLPHFILFYVKNALPFARLGLVLSKKKIAKAHDRQRIKRLLRESFRLQTLAAYDVVVLARQGVSEEEKSSLCSQLEKAWKKLKNGENT